MHPEPPPSTSSLRSAVARLVAAMMVADRRVSTAEIDAAARLDRLGLGPLSPLVRDELQRATRMPIDVEAACRSLAGTGPALVGTVLSARAGLAARDGAIGDDERRVFTAIADRLRPEAGAPADRHAFDARGDGAEPPVTATPAPEDAGADEAEALRAFGLPATATRADVDAAYLRLVERYDPAKVAPLGAEFVLLAVRKLAGLSDLYEAARAVAGD